MAGHHDVMMTKCGSSWHRSSWRHHDQNLCHHYQILVMTTHILVIIFPKIHHDCHDDMTEKRSPKNEKVMMTFKIKICFDFVRNLCHDDQNMCNHYHFRVIMTYVIMTSSWLEIVMITCIMAQKGHHDVIMTSSWPKCKSYINQR